MTLVADRFIRYDDGTVRDLATGERVTLVEMTVTNVAEQLALRDRCLARIDALGGFFIVRAKKGINPTIVYRHQTCRGRAIAVIGERLQPVVRAAQRAVLDLQVALDVKRRVYRGVRHTN